MAYKNEENIKAIIAFFRSKGYPDNFIAGLVGNIQTETAGTFDPKQVQLSYLRNPLYGIASNDDYVIKVDNHIWKDPSGRGFGSDRIGFGLTQLTSEGRKTGYYNYVMAKGLSVGDLYAQLEWIVTEIGSTGYANVRKAIKEDWSIEECARVICTDFERPANNKNADVQQNRINHALELYKAFMQEQPKAETKPEQTKKKIRIMLDAGHDNNRNVSPVYPSYNEATMAWKLQGYLRAELEARGFEVGVTRATKATAMDVVARGKASKGYDLFISLHSNACATESVDRVSGIYLVGSGSVEAVSKEIAEALCKRVTSVMGVRDAYKIYNKVNPTDRNGDGLINDDYYGVLYGAHQVKTAGLILEHSFHTNLKATKWLADDANIQKLAIAEAEVLASYFGSQPIDKNGDPVEYNKETIASAKKYDKNLAGTYTTTATINLRADANANASTPILTLMPKGTKVKCYGYYSLNVLRKWYLVQATIGSVTYKGYAHSGYLKKV